MTFPNKFLCFCVFNMAAPMSHNAIKFNSTKFNSLPLPFTGILKAFTPDSMMFVFRGKENYKNWIFMPQLDSFKSIHNFQVSSLMRGLFLGTIQNFTSTSSYYAFCHVDYKLLIGLGEILHHNFAVLKFIKQLGNFCDVDIAM